MGLDFDKWYQNQNRIEADRILDTIHCFVRLNLNHAMSDAILKREVKVDTALSVFMSVCSLVQERLIKRYEYLTGTKYKFVPDSYKKRDIWKFEREHSWEFKHDRKEN